MTTSNHPENLNTNAAHDLGQIGTESHCPKCGTSYDTQPNMARNNHGHHMCVDCFIKLPEEEQIKFYL